MPRFSIKFKEVIVSSKSNRLGHFTRTQKSEPEPIQKYSIRNQTENIKYLLDRKFFYPKEPEPKKNEQSQPDKSQLIPDLKT